jgi:hypothetical protein
MLRSANNLLALFPGHDVHSTTHYVKHGLAMLTLAFFAFGAAWFTNAPDRSEKSN